MLFQNKKLTNLSNDDVVLSAVGCFSVGNISASSSKPK